jgi:hypothetical protein
MKPIAALMISMFAGATTFIFESSGRQAHAAGFRVPEGASWRQDMLAHDPGEPGIDYRLAMITSRLDLTSAQAAKVRPILETEHDRVEAELLNAPLSLTRSRFVAERNEIHSETRRQIDVLLTHDQLELVAEMRSAPVSARS